MENFTTDINFIIIRYLDGSASLEEKRQLLQWLKESEKNRSDFTDTRDLWLSCNASADNELEVDIALDRLKMRIMNEHERIGKKTRRSFIRWYQAAAVLLVLFGLYFWLSIEQTEPKLMVQNQLITAKGSKGKFTLPDGTVVWLNSESRLVYPDQFADGKRTVNLVGGAYFEVVKDEKKPFIVKAGDVDVEVLGTSFNISSYPFKDNIETALLSGSVKISGPSVRKEIYLKPNEVFEYKRDLHAVSVKSANASLYADWIKDRLVFDNRPLSDILISMEGWYNMDIVCPEKFAESTYMSFTIRQEDIDEILRAMSFIIPISYQIKNGKAFIMPK
ncbi:FecR domain-containing protein [Parabacteroides sp. BX2]|mgnify:FL=1|uniref:FecR domain-containing protein n=1 Tax=Parabacteroides segnis TaxID=2763058 RepID=A0ABR7E4B7_9BACT|nr:MULTISPECIES: FecR family protein [Parabacteroides]MBC5644498.1 FecR domain-containing protein [Parabacteroides segnis]MCM0714431.1 FecR domain-containing protein [Parabacteroides sp. TA-V-105]